MSVHPNSDKSFANTERFLPRSFRNLSLSWFDRSEFSKMNPRSSAIFLWCCSVLLLLEIEFTNFCFVLLLLVIDVCLTACTVARKMQAGSVMSWLVGLITVITVHYLIAQILFEPQEGCEHLVNSP